MQRLSPKILARLITLVDVLLFLIFLLSLLFCCRRFCSAAIYWLCITCFLIRLIPPPAKIYGRGKGSRGYSVACLFYFLLVLLFAFLFLLLRLLFSFFFNLWRLRKELYLVHDGLRRDLRLGGQYSIMGNIANREKNGHGVQIAGRVFYDEMTDYEMEHG